MGRLDYASLVGQDESKGFVTETNEETAQVFISQQIFCVPGGQRQTQAIKQKCLIFFKICCGRRSNQICPNASRGY